MQKMQETPRRETDFFLLVAEKKIALFYKASLADKHTPHMKNAWWWCVTYASPLAARSPLELGLSDGGRRVGRGRRPRGLVKMDRKKCTKKSNFLATVASEKRIFASKISRVVTQLICISRQKKARHFPCQPFVYEKIYNRNYEPGLQSERRPLSP